MRYSSLFILTGLVAGAAFSEDVDLNNRADTTVVSLAPYSIGPSIGVVGAVDGDLSQISEQFLSVSLTQTVRFNETWDLGIDLDWWAPGNNFGGDMTISYVFGTHALQPFVGVGAGIRSLDYEGEPLGKGLGAEGLIQAGVYLDVMDNLQMRVRVPYRYIANSHRDQTAGLDIALLFSSPLRKTKVRKLTY
ncbi:MAG: hypothetical protein K0Q91_1438 [Fibrobacteria bacterium]|jgi:hypothetical protein|nr:hypothetical protein [Fibrobacteria bacterium]